VLTAGPQLEAPPPHGFAVAESVSRVNEIPPTVTEPDAFAVNTPGVELLITTVQTPLTVPVKAQLSVFVPGAGLTDTVGFVPSATADQPEPSFCSKVTVNVWECPTSFVADPSILIRASTYFFPARRSSDLPPPHGFAVAESVSRVNEI